MRRARRRHHGGTFSGWKGRRVNFQWAKKSCVRDSGHDLDCSKAWGSFGAGWAEGAFDDFAFPITFSYVHFGHPEGEVPEDSVC